MNKPDLTRRELLERCPMLARSICCLAMMTATLPCPAHHSFAMFDQAKSVTLQGTVKEFRWTNPHAFIQVLVASAEGKQVEWSVEMASPSHLMRNGWQHTLLKTGDSIRVVIHPMRDSIKGGQYLSGSGPKGVLPAGTAPAPAATLAAK